MNDQKIIEKFEYIEYGEENIQLIYRNNFNLYQYYHSDNQRIKPDELKIVNGIIQNKLPIASNEYDKFHIDENDFKITELALLNSLDESKLNYGQKTKLKLYKEYIQFKLEFPDWYNVKNRNGFYALKRSKLPEYKNAIWSGYFKDVYKRKNEDGSLNDFHYNKSTLNWREQRDKLLKENKNLEPRLKLLLHYNALLKMLIDETVQFFEVVDKYDGKEIAYINSFNLYRFNIIQYLDTIGNFSQNVNHNINTGHYKIALEIQHYCSLMFNDVISFLSSQLFIKIEKSPLKKDFNKVIKQLNKAIDLNKLDFLLRVGGISKTPTEKDNEFNLKETDSIFKSAKGQVVFQKFYAVYKSELVGQQSNFSFLFYALKKFNLITCSVARYVTFCKKHNIQINNVVTRMKYENLKEEDPLVIDFIGYLSEFSLNQTQLQ